jgi:hypothetical protein
MNHMSKDLGPCDSGLLVLGRRSLMTYLSHAGTALYVGYNNGLTNLSSATSPSGLPPSSTNPSPANCASHVFFAQLSYAFGV